MIYNKITEYERVRLLSGFRDVDSQADPVTYRVKKKYDKIIKETFESIKDWKETPPGSLGFIKKYWQKLPFATKQSKEPAGAAYRFTTIDSSSLSKLKSRARIWEIASKILIVSAAIFITISLGGLLGMVPFVFFISEPVFHLAANGLITIGAVGSGALVLYSIFHNNKSQREYRVTDDLDFQYFVEHYIQKPSSYFNPDSSDPSLIQNFNLNNSQIMDRNLHAIFIKWRSDTDSVLNEKAMTRLRQLA